MTEPHGEKSEREDSVMSEKIVQTAGRNALGEFAPEFAHYMIHVLIVDRV